MPRSSDVDIRSFGDPRPCHQGRPGQVLRIIAPLGRYSVWNRRAEQERCRLTFRGTQTARAPVGSRTLKDLERGMRLKVLEEIRLSSDLRRLARVRQPLREAVSGGVHRLRRRRTARRRPVMQDMFNPRRRPVARACSSTAPMLARRAARRTTARPGRRRRGRADPRPSEAERRPRQLRWMSRSG
jgi:hypothetical protein